MLKKFLRTARVLVMLVMTMVATLGVQRFVIHDDDLVGYTNTHYSTEKPLTLTPGTLEWNGLRLNPIRSYHNNKITEYICANESSGGLELIRGQKVKLTLQYQFSASMWDMEDNCMKCCIGCVIAISFPISLPLLLCQGYCNQKLHTSNHDHVGQITFPTEQQYKTLRIKLGSGGKGLDIMPETN